MSGLEELASNWRAEENFPGRFGAASDYAQKMSKRPLSYFEDRIHNIGISGSRVLDAGCGTGTWSFAMLTKFDDIDGIDYVKDRTDYCTFIAEQYGLADRARFRPGNILETGFEDERFDTVFCFGVIIVPQTDLRAALGEFKRVTRPGGEIFVCINAPGWAYYLASAEAEARKATGQKGVYVSLRDRFLSDLPGRLSAMDEPSRKSLADKLELIEAGEKARTLAQFLGDERIADLVSQISSDAGEDMVVQFGRDLAALLTTPEKGLPKHSGYPSTYEPEQVELMCQELGLVDFAWAPEGRLRRSDSPREVKPIYAGSFEDRLANWEFIAVRPK